MHLFLARLIGDLHELLILDAYHIRILCILTYLMQTFMIKCTLFCSAKINMYILSKVHIAIQINFADRYSKKEDVRDAICRNFSASVVADSVATIALFQWFVFILNAKLHFGNK